MQYLARHDLRPKRSVGRANQAAVPAKTPRACKAGSRAPENVTVN